MSKKSELENEINDIINNSIISTPLISNIKDEEIKNELINDLKESFEFNENKDKGIINIFFNTFFNELRNNLPEYSNEIDKLEKDFKGDK
jgi:hypothetical protein